MFLRLWRGGKPFLLSKVFLVRYTVVIFLLLLIIRYQPPTQGSVRSPKDQTASIDFSPTNYKSNPSEHIIQNINTVDHLPSAGKHDGSKSFLVASRDLDDIGDYNDRVDKGHGLLCALKSLTVNPIPQSIWTTLDQMTSTGYEELRIYTPPSYDLLTGMDQFLAGADIPISAGNIEFWGYLHEYDWFPEGSTSPVGWTGAMFQNQLDWVDGVIIADYNISPAFADPSASVFPPLSQWSDIVFISWAAHAPSPTAMQGLKRVVRAGVANDDTKAQIQRAFVASGLATVSVWPGHRFEINPFTFIDPSTGLIAEPFMAMLGSKNGAGVAYLLAQHRSALGVKSINAIRVWAEKEWSTGGDITAENLQEFKPFMSFEIVDTPTGP